nr:unnamed protein product [Callosobruchus analis]
MPKLKEYDKSNDRAVKDVINKVESYRSAEKKYGIPKSTIEFRIKHPGHKDTCGPSPVLSDEEEKILVNWIIDTASKGFPKKANDLKSSVQKFLNDHPRNNPFKNNRPGDGWVKAFLKRHREISERTSESVSSASACVSEKDIRQWFSEVGNYIKESGLKDVIADPSRVYNADETGFEINPSTGKVFAKRGAKNVYKIDRGAAKENITVIFAFSASGQISVPMIIYPYVRFPEKIAKSINPEWGIGRSAKGWMTSETFYEYIANVFHPYLNPTTVRCCCFSTTCLPLAAWRRTVREWDEEHPAEVLNKVTFAPVVEKAIKSSIKAETLVNGFRACGLFPFDPNAIDYTKCLGTNSTKHDNDIQENALLQKPPMDYQTFFKIVGRKKIEQFKTLNQQIPDICSDDFMSLFRIWKYYNVHSGQVEVPSNLIQSATDSEINTSISSIQDIDLTAMNNDIPERDAKADSLDNMDDNIAIHAHQQPPQQSNTTNTITVDVLVHAPKSPFKELQNLKTAEAVSSTPQIRNSLCQINSELFGQYFTTPEGPKRKGKRNIERTPFAITSTKWQEMFRKKQERKETEEKEKEERKRKREEQANIKKNLPQEEQEWLNIAKQFNDVWNFPNCVGSVDGKHVVLQAPINTGSEFFNYKSTFSIVLMAVVDADYCFTFADVGCQGRISDGGVIKNTSFYKKLQGNELHLPSDNALPNTEKVLPYVFVADDAFPLEEHIMKPYPGSHQEDSIERIFNYRLSRARRVVENAFGILSVVFRVLRKPMLLEPHKAAKVVLACIYLHNYLRRSKSSRNIYTRQDTFDQEIDGKIIQGSWRQEREANPTSLLPIRNIPLADKMKEKGTKILNKRNEGSNDQLPLINEGDEVFMKTTGRNKIRKKYTKLKVDKSKVQAQVKMRLMLWKQLIEKTVGFLHELKDSSTLLSIITMLKNFKVSLKPVYVAKSTLFNCFTRVIMALNKIAPDIIKWPPPEERQSIKRQFQNIRNLPGVVGAVDRTYVPIKAPHENPETLYFDCVCKKNGLCPLPSHLRHSDKEGRPFQLRPGNV